MQYIFPFPGCHIPFRLYNTSCQSW